MPHTHTYTHSCTHIWLVSCAFTSFKICINLVLKIYIYILCCPCYLTTFGQPMAGGGGRNGKRKVGERKRNSQAVEILRFLYRMLPLLASPLPSLFVRLRKFCIFPLCTCFSAAREAEAGLAAAASCLFYFKCQII